MTLSSPSQAPHDLRHPLGTHRRSDAAIGCALALACAVWSGFVHYHSNDLRFADESLYLGGGLRFFSGGRPDAENGPLYALLYWLQSVVVHDPIALYYTNWTVGLFLVLVGVVMVSARAGLQRWNILTLTAAVSVSGAFRVWPYVAMPAAAAVLGAAALVLRERRGIVAWVQAAFILLLAAYFRPELALASGLCCTAAAAHAVRDRGACKGCWRPIAAYAVLATVIVCAFGVPFGGGRSAFAFGQHYALNIKTGRALAIDAWLDWEKVFRSDFGHARSIHQALVTNPRAFIWHVGQNLRQLWRCAYLVTFHFPALTVLKVAAGVVATGALTVGTVSAWRASRRDVQVRRLGLLVCFTAAPTLVSAIVIHPRLHYFLAPLAALAAFAITGWGWARRTKPWALPRLAPATAAAIAAAMAVGVGLISLWQGRNAEFPQRAFAAALMKSSFPQGPLRVLEGNIASFVYARRAYRSVEVTECVPFLACVDADGVDIVIEEPRLSEYYKNDPGLAAFRARPHAYGFAATVIPTGNATVYTRAQAQR